MTTATDTTTTHSNNGKTKLNQIIAVEKGLKTRTFDDLTTAHHQLMKQPLLSGIARNYKAHHEEGEQLPPESTRVQVRAKDVIAQTTAAMTRYFDVVATKDWTNTRAKADIVVDGKVIFAGVPATYLVFLEKQMTDIITFIKKLPALDPGENWTYDSATDSWATSTVQTMRTKKTPRNHVKAEATKEHPAQVELYYEDVPVGTWHTTKYSGALPQQQINALLGRAEKLMEAIKYAREAANNTETEDMKVGNAIFSYVFGGTH